MSERILIADDEEIIRDSLSFVLQKENYEVATAPNGAIALEKHLADPYDIIITDIEMPEMKGPELLDRVLQATPEVFVILITAFASINTAIDALRKGAYDYIMKPIEFDDLKLRVARLVKHRRLALENALLRKEVHQQYNFYNIIGNSPAMHKVFETIKRLSHSSSNVLLYGTTGTGKELIARAIHYNGVRKDKPFVTVNCGAVVETLFESELFGHRKGSFTGATCDKLGLFKVANEGTIFLDEISEIPFYLQVKLLRAIEQREIYPVGDTTPIKIDVRLIASTNKDLTQLVEQGKFREDLFYRLNVVQIKLPSLADRPEDIPLLVQHFVQRYSQEMNKLVRGVDNQVMHALLNHKWKGEVRELENVIERALIFTTGDLITINDLPDSIRYGLSSNYLENLPSLDTAMKEYEKKYISQALELCNHDKDKVADILNISTSTLYRRMQEHQIQMKQDHQENK
jgi:two-component system response regulator PilR (NtrC family)